MAFAIRLTTVADEHLTFVRLRNPWSDHWLCAYDPDAHDGFGEATFHPDASEALRFDSFDAAKECWSQQSTVRPELAGRENRPLTICSIVIDEIA